MTKALRRYRVVARMSLQADRGLTYRTFALSAVNFLSGAVVGAVLLKWLTNAVVGRDWSTATAVAVALAAHQGFTVLIARLYGRTYPVLQERNREHYDRVILRMTATIPGIEHYENPVYLDELEQLRFQPQALGQMLAVTVQAFSLLVQTAVIVVLLARIDLRLALVPLVAVPAVVTMRRAQAVVNARWEELAERRRLANEVFGMLTTAGSADEIRMLRLEGELSGRHDAIWTDVDRQFVRAETKASVLSIGGWLVFAVAFVGMVVVAIGRAAAGQATVGDVVLTVALATQLNRQVVTVLEVVSRIIRNSRAVDRFLWLQDYARASAPPEGSRDVPARLESGIDIRGLQFRYPGTDADVLRGIDLHLPAGAVVAVLGENGAGKTTLVKVLTGMYRPTAGTIEVDGVALDALDVERWRERTSAAFQDFARFELHARQSVGVGALEHIDDEAHVRAAMAGAGAEDVAAQLRSGLDTPLGATMDGGVDLSGGQWQKLALGRAMMRGVTPQGWSARPPLLLVLDEPTSSLDPIAERALFDRYAAWAAAAGRAAGTVTLLISHRFSTTRSADLVVVLDDGAVRESGTHDQLMRAGGIYAELYELQASRYR